MERMIFIVGGAYQGRRAFAEEQFPNQEIIADVDALVRKELEDGRDAMEAAAKLCAEHADAVLIGTEMGCGIVPMDSFLRRLREENGRVNCYLAGEAEQFYRVICGRGERLK